MQLEIGDGPTQFVCQFCDAAPGGLTKAFYGPLTRAQHIELITFADKFDWSKLLRAIAMCVLEGWAGSASFESGRLPVDFFEKNVPGLAPYLSTMMWKLVEPQPMPPVGNYAGSHVDPSVLMIIKERGYQTLFAGGGYLPKKDEHVRGAFLDSLHILELFPHERVNFWIALSLMTGDPVTTHKDRTQIERIHTLAVVRHRGSHASLPRLRTACNRRRSEDVSHVTGTV